MMGMGQSWRHSRRKRHVAGAVGAAALAAAVGSPSALAGGLQGVAGSLPPTPAESLTRSVAETVELTPPSSAAGVEATATAAVETVQQAVEQSVVSAPTAIEPTAVATQVASPALEAAQNVAEEPARTATETLAPTASTVRTTVDRLTRTTEPVVAQVLETSAPVVSAVNTVVASSLIDAEALLDEQLATASTTTTAILAAATQLRDTATATPDGTTPAEIAPIESSAVQVATTPATTPRAAPASQPARPVADDPSRPGARRSDISSPSSVPAADPWAVVPRGDDAMPSSQPHAPLPDVPSGPLTALLSAFASGTGGTLVILLAVLAATLFLAAPGLGRRLRLRLAPWPRPILHLSLERPG